MDGVEVEGGSNGKSGGSKIPVRIEKTKTGTIASSGSRSISSTISRSTTTTYISSTTQSGSGRTRSSPQSKKSLKKSDMPAAAVAEELNAAQEVEDQVEVPPDNDNSSEGEDIEPISADNEIAGSVTNLSFQTARTAGSKLSSAISKTSQKGITVLSNAYQQATSMLTGSNRNNNGNGSNVEVLYPRSRSTRSSSRQKSVSALEEEFKAKSRASAMGTQINESDEDDLEEELIQEEASRAAKIYKQIQRILRYLFFLAINVIGAPIYWILVQAFVLEKWILYRSPPSPPTPRQQQQGTSWFRTLWILSTVLILVGIGFSTVLWTNQEMMEIWASTWPLMWNNSEKPNASFVENRNKT